jgi:hypothetical protein
MGLGLGSWGGLDFEQYVLSLIIIIVYRWMMEWAMRLGGPAVLIKRQDCCIL